MLLSRFADETDLPDWYFIWFLRFDSFCFSLRVFLQTELKSQAVCFEGSYVGFDLCHGFGNVCFVDKLIARLKWY